jgi:hypothetical protein
LSFFEKLMQKQRKLADVFRQKHRIPGNKLLHPRHEPDTVG